jgi:hypothetical protein
MAVTTDRRYVALNGFGYSIAKWLPDYVQTPFRLNWTRRRAYLLAQELQADPRPTTLIGFSDGATAALHVAEFAWCVTEVHCHSCLSPRRHTRTKPITITFYRTIGDTTPTVKATYNEYKAYEACGYDAVLIDLPYKEFDEPSFVERVMLSRLRHQFHNAVPWLKLPP